MVEFRDDVEKAPSKWHLCIFLEKDTKKEKFKDITNKVVTVVTLAVAIITLIILMSGDETTIDTTSSTSNTIGKL